MKLISCEECGVVLNQDMIIFPDPYNDDASISSERTAWEGDDFRLTFPCPVCEHKIVTDRKV